MKIYFIPNATEKLGVFRVFNSTVDLSQTSQMGAKQVDDAKALELIRAFPDNVFPANVQDVDKVMKEAQKTLQPEPKPKQEPPKKAPEKVTVEVKIDDEEKAILKIKSEARKTYTAMNYNKLKAKAKGLGYKGDSFKKSALVDFMVEKNLEKYKKEVEAK